MAGAMYCTVPLDVDDTTVRWSGAEGKAKRVLAQRTRCRAAASLQQPTVALELIVHKRVFPSKCPDVSGFNWFLFTRHAAAPLTEAL